MRNLFSKSISVIIINIYTALFLTIALSNLVYAYYQTYVYADGLEGDFCLASFVEDKSSGEFYKEFYSSFNSICEDDEKMHILRYNDTGNCGVYSSDNNFANLDIQSGRNFEMDDFKYNKNVAVISDTMKEKCIDDNGTPMIQIGNGFYEVVGFFSYNSNNTINPNSYVYYNLFSENMFEDTSNIGQLAIDISLTDKLSELFSINDIAYPTKISFSERLSLALFSQSITITPLCLVLIAVILNSINITINWVNNNKKELVVRRICGANIRDLSFLLVRKYFILTSFSYILGFILAYILSKFNYSLYIGFDFSIITILISYLATMIMSVLSIIILLTFGNIESVTALRGN